MKVQEIRHNIASMWDSVAEGWEHMRQRASSALTRFLPGDKSNLPAREQIDDASWLPGTGWAMLGGDLFEDEQRIVVRVEVPGMSKEDLQLDVVDGGLVVRGEKRFESEQTEGRWRVLQCAYGSFYRSIALPAPVIADQARASYRNGVLRVELPKRQPAAPRGTRIRVL